MIRARADAGHERDPLDEAERILIAADAAGRSITLFERHTLRGLVHDHESHTGESLLGEAQRIFDRTASEQRCMTDDERHQVRLALDVLDVLHGLPVG